MPTQNQFPALTLALATLASLTMPAAAQDKWLFSVTPYLWVASIDAETSLASGSPSTPWGVDRFDTRISAGAMFAAQAHYQSVGFLFDFAWLRLDSEASDPGPAFSSGDLQSDFIHTTAALSYRLPLHGKFHAEVLAGARLWYVNEEVSYASGALPGFNASDDATWVDPVVGLDLRYDLSQRWSVGAKAMVGGFGVAADLAWEAFAGVNYQVTDWCLASLGYRYLHEEYNRDEFALDMDVHGVVLGVGFHF